MLRPKRAALTDVAWAALQSTQKQQRILFRTVATESPKWSPFTPPRWETFTPPLTQHHVSRRSTSSENDAASENKLRMAATSALTFTTFS